MDLNRVALFSRVVESGSFTQAAEKVGLPKSSVSRAVSQLEKELGVRLLQRTTRKLALTDAGHAYYESIRSAVLSLEEADAHVRELGAEPSGRVRVTAPSEFSSIDLAEALALFVKKHPAIRIELALTSRVVDLVAEGFDLAIRAGKLEDSSLIARRIGGTELALFAAPAYLKRHGRPKGIDQLRAHAFVLYRAHEGRATLRLSEPEGASVSIDVAGALVADEMSFCVAACEAGAGIALLPVHAAIEAVSARRLEQVLPGFTHGGDALFVVLPSSRYVPARVALVRDFLVAHLTKKLAEVEATCTHSRARPR